MKLATILLTVFALAAFKCGGTPINPPYIPATLDRALATTPIPATIGGVKMSVEQGVSVSPAQMAAIDRGLGILLSKTRCRYGRSQTLADYKVAVIVGVPGSDGMPEFKVSCGVYCGGIYDKGGYVTAAGQVASVGSPYGNIIVVAAHVDTREQLEHLERVIGYEGEHGELAYWDGDFYKLTEIHTPEHPHPLWECTGGRDR
jgi:hypothetical protein